jgi:5'-nucleotidase
MNILLTNDDGIQADGIKALQESVPPGVLAVVAAPASERSACSHSISLGQKLRIEEMRKTKFPSYAVHGTPADCVKFAISTLPGFKPDLIVSGINHGANTGVSVYYSGTISAAREGFINRFPGVAVSLCGRGTRDFRAAVDITRQLILGYQQGQFPLNVMLNVNVPGIDPKKIKGVKITKQAASHFIEEFVPEKSHDGKKVFTLAGEIEVYNADGTSDEEAVADGYISITPLKLDLTDYEAIPHFASWLQQTKGIKEKRS